jgi:hypothetical protein
LEYFVIKEVIYSDILMTTVMHLMANRVKIEDTKGR